MFKVLAQGEKKVLTMGGQELELVRDIARFIHDNPSENGFYSLSAVDQAALAEFIRGLGELEGADGVYTVTLERAGFSLLDDIMRYADNTLDQEFDDRYDTLEHIRNQLKPHMGLSFKILSQSEDNVEIGMSGATLSSIQTLMQSLDHLNLQAVVLPNEKAELVGASLAKASQSDSAVSVSLSGDDFSGLYKIISSAYRDRKTLGHVLSEDIITDLKVSADGIFHKLAGRDLTLEQQETIRATIDANRESLEELYRRDTTP